MQVTEHDVGTVTVINVSGRLTLAENPGHIKETVNKLVAQGRKHIVLNMAGVTYVDSSWLGELVACHLSAVRGGSVIKLANAGGRLENLLMLTRLMTVLEVHDSEASAISSFANLPV